MRPTDSQLTAEEKRKRLRELLARKAQGPRTAPLSFHQEQLWVMDQLEPGGTMYLICEGVRMRGELDRAALARSLDAVAARHDALRTSIVTVDGQAVQQIARRAALPLVTRDLGELPAAEREAALQRLAGDESRCAFDLGQGPLMRALLARMDARDHVLLLTMHHIISDGWSAEVLIRDLGIAYGAFIHGREPSFPPLPIQYADYAVWQRRQLEGQRLDDLIAYWKQALAGAPPALELPADRPRPPVQTANGALHRVEIPAQVARALAALGREHGATLFMVLVAAFQALLHRYTRADDVVIGTPVANRHRAETEGVIGFFVNTLVLRGDLSGDPTFLELLERVRATTLGAYEHQDLPFERLVSALEVERDLSRSPVFQVMFEMQTGRAREIPLPGLRLTPLEFHNDTAKFDLLLLMSEGDDGLTGVFEYNTDLFDAATIERLGSHLCNLVAGVVADPRQRISCLPLLSDEERHALAHARNRTDVDWRARFPDWHPDVCFPALFEAQVARRPGATAVICDGRALSYAELRARAGKVAHALRGRGCEPDVIVPILLDRGIELLVAMLGVLEAGAAFVPLDPALTRHRLATIVDAVAPPVLVTDREHDAQARDILGDGRGEGRAVLDIAELVAGDAPRDLRAPAIRGHHLAYAIFTSGSTGTPKGALIHHSGMINHMYAKIVDLGMSEGEVIAQTSTQSFDVCVWQFMNALLVGGTTVVLTGDDAWEPSRLLDRLTRERITVFETVPAHMRLILDELESRPGDYDLSGMRWLVVNGEPLLPEICERWFALYPGVPMINAYGPTECSDDVTHYKMHAAPSRPWKYMPIHGTLPNLRVYVVDGNLEPVPHGVAGELCVGGVGVGRGYLADPARTARIFVPDPFGGEPGARMYRTGDLVRLLADGSIEFLGRLDHQVKIRGLRIEIGEIEAVLAQHDQVRECIVLAREDEPGDKRLVAYVVCHGGAGAEPRDAIASLVAHLEERLPRYMVPSAFVIVDRFPLLPNGKIDRESLPVPGIEERAAAVDRTPPRTPVESLIAEAWAELLGIDAVGVHESFFDIGGHSLIAIQTISRVRRELGVELGVRDLFEARTVARLAALVERRQGQVPAAGSELRLERAPDRDAHELVSYQLPHWYMHELDPDSPFYNVDIVLGFEGELDRDAFVRTWQDLIARHEGLRTYFATEGGKPVMKIAPAVPLAAEDIFIDRTDLAESEIDETVRALAAEYTGTVWDFGAAPLFRLRVIELPGQRHVFVFVIHHILWDETSTLNLGRDMAALYNAHRAGVAPALPPLGARYVDFAHTINSALAAGRLDHQRRYWLERFATLPPALDLPTDFPRPPIQTFNGDTVEGRLPAAVHERLDRYLKEQGVTLYIYLLAVLNALLHRLTGQDDIVIGSPIANRDFEEVQSVLGMFATALPMRSRIAPDMSFRALLDQAATTSLEAYDNHVYPSVLAIQEINPHADLSRSRLFSIMYGVQNNKNRFVSELRFDDLALTEAKVESTELSNARFDLTLVVDEFGSDVVLALNYNTDLFTEGTARRMLGQFVSLVEQTLADPGRPLSAYRLLTEDEEQRLVVELNDTARAVDDAQCLHWLFERQVDRDPGRVALCHDRGTVSYGELEQRANRWAAYLREHGVRPADRVALVLEPGPDMVAAMLAVLKCGAGYVPISPDQPMERQLEILHDAGARAVLTTMELAPDTFDTDADIFAMDAPELALERFPAARPAPAASPDHLAYIIYTSGTTGTPKGIPIAHRGVINLLADTQARYQLTAADTGLFLTSYAFDASILDVFWPLAEGACVALPGAEESKDPRVIAALVERHGVTFLQCVPTMLDALCQVRAQDGASSMDSLRLVICGGSYMTRDLRDRFRRVFSCALANHYGPTETSVDATVFDTAEDFDGDVVPIGRPIANTRAYVLDRDMSPVPPGVRGELYIGSPGLARGYLGQPGRTAACFVPDPFAPTPGARLYRTGDIVRRDEQGVLHFCGRVDKQVKVRGNRVELEDIETHLARDPHVARCAVRCDGAPGSERLVAHVELHASAISIAGDSGSFRMFTLAQRPDLRPAVDALHAQAWPEYFLGSEVMRAYWPRALSEHAAYQFLLVSERDELLAVGNAVPTRWGGTDEELTGGWDWALVRSFELAAAGAQPDTLLVLAGVVDAGAQGRGLSRMILTGFKNLAAAHGFGHVIVPVRPVGKASDPALAIEDWARTRRPDGQLEDRWLRTHERVGGRMMGAVARSQRVTAAIRDWERWTGARLDRAGEHMVPEALQPVRVDLERGEGEYWDPCVWFAHPVSAADCTWRHVDATALRRAVREGLPAYMVPDVIRFVTAMPLTAAGKIDEQALGRVDTGDVARVIVPPRTGTERRLVALWQELLGSDDVGVTSDFFELGGHSMAAVQMLAAAGEIFGVRVRLRDFYRDRNVASLAAIIEEKRESHVD